MIQHRHWKIIECSWWRGYDAVILVWHTTCIWLQYIIVMELSKFCADNLNDLGVIKDFLISLIAYYTTGWLIDHAWKSNKQITIVFWPNKIHHKMDFYIFKQHFLLHLSIFYEYQQFCQHRICFSIQPPDYSDRWPTLARSTSFFLIMLFKYIKIHFMKWGNTHR
jgi:hypothetical protein